MIFVYSCSKDDDGKGEEQINSDNNVTALANFNPDEPIILDVSNDKGDAVILMGSKSETGSPEKVEEMIISTQGEENPTEIILDEKCRIVNMIAPNGVKFHLDWVDETKYALTLVDPNTNEQLNTVVDLDNPSHDNNQVVAQSRALGNAVRSGEARMVLEGEKASASLPALKQASRAVTGTTGLVYVKNCDVPVWAEVWVDAYDYSDATYSYGRGKFRGRFRCTPVEKGVYRYTIPGGYHEHHDIADYCSAIDDVVGTICNLNAGTTPGVTKEYMCVAISAAIAGGIVSAPVAAAFLAACTSTAVAIDTACFLLNGNTGLPPGATGNGTLMGSALCDRLREMDFTWETPLFLIPKVTALPKDIIGTPQVFEAGAQLEYMTVKWGGQPGINTFSLNPPAPVQGQSYQAVAELYCLPLGTAITMDIIGTDNYHNSITQYVDALDDVIVTSTLYVPGAASGVMDVCTVTAVTPDGKTVTKKASLVFQ